MRETGVAWLLSCSLKAERPGNRVDEKEKDDTKVKRSKRKPMITTGPSRGIGDGITNAFVDPRLQRRFQFARRFQSPGFEQRTWRYSKETSARLRHG
jgi:hypothetical protein